jgi:hypothetical protein
MAMFSDGDLDRAQDAFDAMPAAAHEYMARAMIHNAGLGKDPGQYTGPSVTDPEAKYKEDNTA